MYGFSFIRGRACAPALVALLLALLLLVAAERPGQAQLDRRVDTLSVCLERDATLLVVEGESLHFFDNELDLLLEHAEGMQTHRISAGKDGIAVDGMVFDTTQLRIRSTQNWTRIKGRIYREDLLVVRTPEKPDRLTLVNEIQLEPYLYGLINKECLASWPDETKRAQAVAARTYALHKRVGGERPVCDLESTTADQVYGGYSAEDPSARAAVDSTRGEVLTYNNRIAKTFYHANCGGHTASSETVWKELQAYLPARPSPWAEGTPGFAWTYSISVSELARLLEVPAAARKGFRFDILARSDCGRVATVRLHEGGGSRTVTGEQFRKAVGYTNLKSTLFTFSIKAGMVHFSGKGMGHGVGMCQWSAARMAASGSDYRAILQFFYPGTEIRRLY